MSFPRIFPLAFVSLFACFAGCDDGGEQPNPNSPGDGGPTAPDPFNGDCSTARWSNVSDACWSCMCGACSASLNACNESCTDVFECAVEKQVLVNVGADILCEIRGTAAECLAGAPEGAAQALIAFDTCLISAMKPSGFRVCEDVCQIPYPGDVCTRYPQ